MTATNGRVDFRLAKQVITLQMLLDHYNVTGLRKSGDERVGECPLCHGKGKRQFKANITRNVFRCFACNAQGDIIAFVKAIEGCATLADAGVKLRELFPEQLAAAEAANGSSAPMQAAPVVVPTRRAVDHEAQAVLGALFLRIVHDGRQPVRERAQELIEAHPWITSIDICEPGGAVVITVGRE